MTRFFKRLSMIATDAVVIPLALLAAFALRLGDLTPPVGHLWWLFLLMPVLSLPVFAGLGFYRVVVRYMGPHAVVALLKGITVSTLVLAGIVLLLRVEGFPRSVLPLYWLLILVGIGGSRFVARAYFQSRGRGSLQKKPVIIYGAGSAGAQLASALAAGNSFHPVAMVDDDRSLHGSVIAGIPVYAAERLGELVYEHSVEDVLLAIPSTTRGRRKQILQKLEGYPVHVKTIPGLMDLVSGKARLDEIREVDIEDLLGRDPVSAQRPLMAACTERKNVMVTGAGGSIGSELCRQILRCQPNQLILFEISEYGLYRIERELRGLAERYSPATEIIPLLGSVTDRDRLRDVMQAYVVDTVYHAAAFKHVPIVEHNVIEGVRNNTLGTWYTAEAAYRSGVRDFVLISTDKAVRPTNVMGASKRLAEMTLQAMARRDSRTTLSIVRFGNVLGSSGSVVPLFREQIRQGGPVTVTHPEITRYFMTIPEAAALVIQAGAMAKGGDVYVLDMGEPVRIVDLARKMIHLMGHKLKDEGNPAGEIEIRFTGLRPGEKLYEELLIGGNIAGTEHPKIHRAQEWAPDWPQMSELLDDLEAAVEEGDCPRIRGLLLETVQGYTTGSELPDLVWRQQRENDATAQPDKVARLIPRRRDS